LDDTVRLWDATSGAEVYRLPGHGRLGGARAVGFAADGKSFVSFGDDFYLRSWDVRTGKALYEYKLRPEDVKLPEENEDSDPFDRLMRMSRAIVSPDGRLLAIAIEKFVLFDAKIGKEFKRLENPGTHVIGLAFSADGTYLLASCWGKPVETKLADGRIRHSTGENNPITLWDTASGEVLRQIILPAGGVGSVVFSPDGSRFAISAQRSMNSITVYETDSGNKLRTIESMPCQVSTVAFTHNGRGIIGGLADGTAVIWPVTE
jgi:WD40 repeat protein